MTEQTLAEASGEASPPSTSRGAPDSGKPIGVSEQLEVPSAGRSAARPIYIVVVLVLVALLVGKSSIFAWSASDSAVVEVLRERAPHMNEAQKGAALLVASIFDEYRNVARMWSAVYNGCVLGASALGLLAALVLKLESAPQLAKEKKDAAAALASIGAILAALSSSGDFQMKWQANRSAVAEVERIAVSLLAPTPPDLAAVYAELGSIAEDRHLKLIGAKRPADRPPGEKTSQTVSGSDRATSAATLRVPAAAVSAAAAKSAVSAQSSR